jgi:hypothetical protein
MSSIFNLKPSCDILFLIAIHFILLGLYTIVFYHLKVTTSPSKL